MLGDGSIDLMIVMREGASAADIDHVLQRLAEAGARGHVSTGDLVTVIGVIGDREMIAGLPHGGVPGGGQGPAHPATLQARQPGVPAQRHGDPDRAEQDRRRALRPDRRTLLGRDREQILASAAYVKAAGATMMRGGRLQAAHLALRLPGAGCRGAQDPGRGARGDGTAHRHRVDGPAAPGRRGRVRRRHPDRRAQHAELLPAGGGGRGRQAGAAQAGPVGHHRRAADGGRVHRQGGQRPGHPVRAGHPHLRDRHAQHPGHLGDPGASSSAPTCPSSSIPATPPARWSSSSPSRWRRSRPGPTACSSRPIRLPRPRSATADSRSARGSSAAPPARIREMVAWVGKTLG